MIPITSTIIGPGINEEYLDLQVCIDFLLDAWKSYGLSNNTPHGRIVFFLFWLKQELAAERIPIPLDRSYLGTIKYLVGSGEVDGPLPVTIALEQINNILQGRSLVKLRHVPVVISMIDDFVDEMHHMRPEVIDDSYLAELQQKRDDLAAGRITLPLPDAEANRFDRSWGKSRYARRRDGSLDLEANKAATRVLGPFLGRVPYPARKPPMAAPRLGLPLIARDRDSESRRQ